MKRTTLFIIAAAVLGAAIILFVAIGDSPQQSDVVGTMGAAETDRPIAGVEQAERYRAQQIGDDAVTLDNPEIQELLQDDEVLRIVQDPAFQRAMSSETMRRGLMSEELQRAIVNAEFARALGQVQPQVQATALNRAQVVEFANRTFPNSELARTVINDEALARVLINNQGLSRAIAAEAQLGRAIVANQDLRRLFANPEALSFMAQMQRSGIYETSGFHRVLQSEAAFGLLAEANLREAFFNRAAMSAPDRATLSAQ